MARFQKLLIPVDLSDRGHTALEWLSRIGDPDTRSLLLHVIETLDDVPFQEMEDFYQGLETRARGVLDGWVEELDRQGVPAERRVVFGHRLQEILRIAEEESPDLLLLASHPVEPDTPGRGWATLSYRLAVLAPCPVLLAK